MTRIAVFLAFFAALSAQRAAARPYLMLDADETGFKALDLGAVDRSQPASARVTLIEAPLKGAPIGDKLAPLVERRIEVDCQAARWRILASAFVDGQEREMGKDAATGPWTAFAGDIGRTVQQAACHQSWRQQAVSRYLNLGEILANFQAAHAKPRPQPQTEQELRAQRYRNGH